MLGERVAAVVEPQRESQPNAAAVPRHARHEQFTVSVARHRPGPTTLLTTRSPVRLDLPSIRDEWHDRTRHVSRENIRSVRWQYLDAPWNIDYIVHC